MEGWEGLFAIAIKESRTIMNCQSAAIRKGERFACLMRLNFSKLLSCDLCFAVKNESVRAILLFNR